MKFTSLSLILFLFFAGSGFAQMKLIPGESFLGGVPIKKMFVAVEDHSVWALSKTGQVYLKRELDPEFAVYAATASMVVEDITGFNAEEMYFQVSPKVYTFKNSVKTELTVPVAGVTRVNNISVVHVQLERPIDNYYNLPMVDWIAFATNKDMYMLKRGTTSGFGTYDYGMLGLPAELDWKITNAGYNSVDFQYAFPSGRCIVDNHTTVSTRDALGIVSTLPDRDGYPSINCTLYAERYVDPFTYGSSWFLEINIWGTNDGIYARNWTCNAETKKLLSGIEVYDLDEVDALSAILKEHYIIASTNHGIYYTPKAVYRQVTVVTNIDKIQFEPLTSITEKINGTCVDTKVYSSFENINDTYSYVCQKVIWVATETGVKKIYVALDQEGYTADTFSEFNFSALKSNTGFDKAVFETCGEQTVTATIRRPESVKNQLLIQWYKDGVELTDWIGQLTVTMKESGTYLVKLTSLCEGITINSIPITVNNSTAPEITFAYPAEINICEGGSFNFSTVNKAGYSYRWFKDNIQVGGQTGNSYFANAAGSYRVEVSNCSGNYVSSSAVKLNIATVPSPVIVPNKENYCKGDAATLSINNAAGYQIKWFIDGIEQAQYADRNSISTGVPGNYTAAFQNSSNCSKTSLVYNFIPREIPQALIVRSTSKSLCYGETVTLTTATLPGATYLWNTGERTASIVVKNGGKYRVEVTSAYGCIGTSAETEVKTLAPVLLNEPEDVKVCTISAEQARLSAEPGYLSYTWNGKIGGNYLDVTKPGQYTLEVEDVNGCRATTTYLVLAWCKELTMPNAFSPNGDGTNDFWTIGGLENDPTATIIIFNRNGAVVFEGRGSMPVWDGKYKGNDLPAGVYYYLIRTKNSANPAKGSVTIIR